ncbi:MAG: hypothetical protein M0R17_06020 [Candidatus Omnitrophica bacterium]|jgi:hypothetical protein|nr:hypothetical protein [Candidatus Omnitrophota bacterium]
MKEKKEKESSEIKRLEALRNKSFSKSKSLSKEIRDTKKEFREKGESQEDLNKALKQIKEKRSERRYNLSSGVLAHSELIGNRLGSAVARQFKKPLLKKPSVSIKTISSTKLAKQFAGSGYSMFKSEPRSYQEQPQQDNHSMFFNETFNQVKKQNGFL